MSHYERMEAGLIYDPSDEEIMNEQLPNMDRLYDFNHTRPSETDKRQAFMKEVFAECGENCWIEPPFYANWGGAHLHLGDGVYANFGLTLVDDAHIYVGNRVLFAPHVTIATANHPLDRGLRSKGLQYARDVKIGDDTWIGANSVILPGVTIGKNTVIGAGSVVTHDIPDNVLAFGVPCRVIREIGEYDHEYFRKGEAIDWQNLQEYAED
ncbi:MAG: sugar O-acetyltransferase [Solobacterium sp.]|nr:sugar O-acetyltransferase [Solobacterium sp.]